MGNLLEDAMEGLVTAVAELVGISPLPKITRKKLMGMVEEQLEMDI